MRSPFWTRDDSRPGVRPAGSELVGDEPVFKLADGTLLESSRAHVRTPENDVARVAVAALEKLELGAREARAWVEKARAQPRAEPWTPEELVREALRLYAG